MESFTEILFCFSQIQSSSSQFIRGCKIIFGHQTKFSIEFCHPPTLVIKLPTNNVQLISLVKAQLVASVGLAVPFPQEHVLVVLIRRYLGLRTRVRLAFFWHLWAGMLGRGFGMEGGEVGGTDGSGLRGPGISGRDLPE